MLKSRIQPGNKSMAQKGISPLTHVPLVACMRHDRLETLLDGKIVAATKLGGGYAPNLEENVVASF
jgi:hypothetical protein